MDYGKKMSGKKRLALSARRWARSLAVVKSNRRWRFRNFHIVFV